jgi:hypothetical protein
VKQKTKIVIGGLLVLIGLLVTCFSNQIAFPGLERWLGIETMVGKGNVVYLPDGGYAYTNPGAMMSWIAAVAVVGIVISASGIWFSGIRIKFPTKTTVSKSD